MSEAWQYQTQDLLSPAWLAPGVDPHFIVAFTVYHLANKWKLVSLYIRVNLYRTAIWFFYEETMSNWFQHDNMLRICFRNSCREWNYRYHMTPVFLYSILLWPDEIRAWVSLTQFVTIGISLWKNIVSYRGHGYSLLEKGKRIKGLGFGGGFKYGSILSANSQFFIPTTEFNFEFLQIWIEEKGFRYTPKSFL